MVRQLVPHPRGGETFVYTKVRFFYHRPPQGWLVVDVIAADQETTVEVALAGSGVEEKWVDQVLEQLQTSLRTEGARMDRKMRVSGKAIELDRSYDWGDLFLDPDLKRTLRDEIESFFDRREIYEEMGLPHRRGILVHGPPGTGKTLLGKMLASRLEDCAFIWITAADVASVHQISYIFDLARNCERCVLFFEDLDFYASQRHYGGSQGTLGELLVQMDGMESNCGLLVVATTNDIEAIEPALRERPSRFDRVVEFGVSTAEVRLEHAARLFEGKQIDEEALEQLILETEGMTGAQLQEFAVAARKQAAGRGSARIEREDLATALDDALRFRAKVVGFDRSALPVDPLGPSGSRYS